MNWLCIDHVPISLVIPTLILLLSKCIVIHRVCGHKKHENPEQISHTRFPPDPYTKKSLHNIMRATSHGNSHIRVISHRITCTPIVMCTKVFFLGILGMLASLPQDF